MGELNSFDIINNVFFLSLKITIVSCVVLTSVKYSRSSSSKTLHAFCCYTLLGLLFLALSTWFIPAFHLHIIPDSFALAFNIPFFVEQNGSIQSNHWLFVCFGFYFFVVFSIIGSRLYDLFRLKGLRRQAQYIDDVNTLSVLTRVSKDLGLKHVPELKQSNEIRGPVTWGLRAPVILLPLDYVNWQNGRLHRILTHELAHVKRRDWLHSIWIRCVLAVFWFLPPVWAIASQILWRAELACDEWVLEKKHCPLAYADDLKELALGQSSSVYSAMSFIERSSVFLRIDNLLDSSVYRDPWSKAKSIGYILFSGSLCLALASLKLSAYAEASHVPDKALKVFPLHILQEEPTDKTEWHCQQSSTGRAMASCTPDEKAPLTIKPDVKLIESLPSFNLTGINQNSFAKFVGFDIAKPKVTSISKPSVLIRGYMPLVTVMPVYPKKAIRRGIEGKVIVQFDILSTGMTSRSRVVYAEPVDVFEKAVLNAVARFKFKIKNNNSNVGIKNVSETFLFRLTESAIKSPKKSIRFNRATQFATN